MHLCGLFSRQLSHSPCNIHSSAPLSHDFLLDPTFFSLLLIRLSFPLPHPLYYSFPPQSLFTCFVVPFSPFLSLLQASVFFPPCSLSYPPNPHLVSLLHIPTVLPFFPFLPSLLASPELLLLRNFLVKYLSDVEWCSASGIDCKVEFAVKARHRPDNLSLYFRLSGAGEQLKLPNKKCCCSHANTYTHVFSVGPGLLALFTFISSSLHQFLHLFLSGSLLLEFLVSFVSGGGRDLTVERKQALKVMLIRTPLSEIHAHTHTHTPLHSETLDHLTLFLQNINLHEARAGLSH